MQQQRRLPLQHLDIQRPGELAGRLKLVPRLARAANVAHHVEPVAAKQVPCDSYVLGRGPAPKDKKERAGSAI